MFVCPKCGLEKANKKSLGVHLARGHGLFGGVGN